MASLINRVLTSVGRLVVYLQVLCFLPLSLDLGGRDCFLAYSASLASYYALLSTFRLVVKRTRFEPIGHFLAAFQILVIPISLLVCFNVYSPPAESYFAEVRRNAAAAAAAGSEGGSLAASFSSASSAAAAGSTGVANGLGSAAAAVASAAVNKLPFTGNSARSNAHASPPPPSAPEHIASFVEWLLTPPTSEEAQRAFAAAVSAFFWVAKRVPPSWSALLRFSSPVFSLLEAVSTLLVIQSLGGLSRSLIASSLRRPRVSSKRAPTSLLGRLVPKSNIGLAELWQILFLLLSAFTYVISAIILVLSFEGATRGRPGAAAAVGACVSSVFWLTAISFALSRGNVVETSMIAAYVTFNVVQLPDSLAFTADPLALIRSFKYAAAGAAASGAKGGSVAASLLLFLGIGVAPAEPGSPATGHSTLFDPSKHLPRIVIESTEALWSTLGYALTQSIDFIAAAASVLPASVIVSLVYRLVVLYAAIRILPRLKANANAHAAAARRNAAADARWAKANAHANAVAAPYSANRTSRMLGVSSGVDPAAGRTPQRAYTRSSPRNSGVRAPISTPAPLSSAGLGRPGIDPDAPEASGSAAPTVLASTAAPLSRLGTESEGIPEPTYVDNDPAGVLDLGLGDETEVEADGEGDGLELLGARSRPSANGLRRRGNGAASVGANAILEESDGEDEEDFRHPGERRLRDEEPPPAVARPKPSDLLAIPHHR
ncbi:hypothetical protein OC846_001118 [Tilletia horrida]|uniref:Uncharacterized protein n=1 Tax=Tilletia horrida TaxID=155126 RepID=A0AAN6JU54_9BASI|nr:hypothetical protein OC846_001118 [Tilletia horrida]